MNKIVACCICYTVLDSLVAEEDIRYLCDKCKPTFNRAISEAFKQCDMDELEVDDE